MQRAVAWMFLLALAGCTEPEGDPAPSTPSAPLTPTAAVDFLWTSLAGGPTPRTEVAAAAEGARIVVVAGFTRSGGTSDVVEIYDPANDSWSDAPAYPIGVNHAMAATLDGRVHVFGGYDAEGAPRAESYRLDDDGWTRRAARDRRRPLRGALECDGRQGPRALRGPHRR